MCLGESGLSLKCVTTCDPLSYLQFMFGNFFVEYLFILKTEVQQFQIEYYKISIVAE
jgi:hypothetical protein